LKIWHTVLIFPVGSEFCQQYHGCPAEIFNQVASYGYKTIKIAVKEFTPVLILIQSIKPKITP